MKQKQLYPKSVFTIRRKRKEKHPQIIVGADRTKFKSVGLTHSKKDRGRNNYPLKSNPNVSDERQAYFKKRIIEDFKFRFSKEFKNFKLTNNDIESLKKFLDSKKQKK